ncbi:MAG: LLM class F420-dependent oxidoreductase [Terracoccus sp.]
MDLHLFTEPQQGATYDDLLGVTRAAEDLGFDGFFRSDHYLHMSGDGGVGPTDAWTTLAGLARETTRIRLGTLVTPATFRLPGPLAVQVAGVDRMSGGRVDLGLGAGWFAAEHTAYGIPFPEVAERFDRFEEQLAVITGMWRTEVGQTFSHPGPHYPVVDSPALAKPAQPGGVPIIIGGGGKRRTPALAARYAAEFNAGFVDPERTRSLFERAGDACEAIGRARTDLRTSAAQVICLGRDETTLRRRADAMGRDLAELRENGLAGTPDEVRERLAAFEAVGADRMYLQVLDLSDLDHLADIADALVRP